MAEQIEFQRWVLIERDQSGDASFEGGSKSFPVIADAQPASSPPRAKEVVAAKWASITRVDTNGGQPLTLRWTIQFLFLIYSIQFLHNDKLLEDSFFKKRKQFIGCRRHILFRFSRVNDSC